MKKHLLIIVSLITLSTIVATAHDDENPDQASSDVINKHFSNEEYNIVLKKKDLAGLPTTLNCGKDYYGNESTITLEDHLGLEQYGPGLYLSNIDADSLMINGSDGDQVGMIKMKMSELKALAKGQIPSLLALTADGFWWADGDHIDGGTTVCTLGKSKARR